MLVCKMLYALSGQSTWCGYIFSYFLFIYFFLGRGGGKHSRREAIGTTRH
jgi:hypothetical protein